MAFYRRVALVVCITVLSVVVGCKSGDINDTRHAQLESAAPIAWAKPVQLSGVDNFYKVSDDLYRGEQPTKQGFEQLKRAGIKTVVNLRGLHSDRSKIKGLDLGYEQIGMAPWSVDDKDMVKFLRIVTDPRQKPVFVHCKRGADRTGVVVAVYRVVVQGWDKSQAIDEMVNGGFRFDRQWDNLVKYIENLDVNKMRAAVRQ